MQNNTDLVNGFINCWCNKDVDGIMSYFTDDAVYINIPMDPPNVGVEAIRAFIEGFIGMATEIDFVIHNQIDNGAGVIMNERTDRFLINDAWVELPVMGVFEISNGKIAKWRDYFDMGQFNAQS